MTNLKQKLAALQNWQPPHVPETIPQGDMPGDKVQIGLSHIAKANTIFPLLLEQMKLVDNEKIVVSVFGGSGVGKSETASLLAWYLNCAGIGAYVMSGDNYPRRIPMYNDAERNRIFRVAGLQGMLTDGVYSDEAQAQLNQLWEQELDAEPAQTAQHLWLESYQKHGRAALASYLGTALEQDFDEINGVISNFRSGVESGWLKRMGRIEDARWYSQVDFRNVDVLILEWTHGNNAALQGIDIPILLNSTPEETREHRRSRARDGKTDSAFTTMVLEIEQAELDSRAPFAKIIISKAGEVIDPEPLLNQLFKDLYRKEVVPLIAQGLEEVLRVDVVLTGCDVTEKPDCRLVHLPFVGNAVCELFTGEIQPGAADEQIHVNGKMQSACADYVIVGKDYTGESCSIHVVNRNQGSQWKPTVTTDSKALDFFNGADCFAVLEIRKQGPIVHIFTKR